jgi:hypothetical protein
MQLRIGFFDIETNRYNKNKNTQGDKHNKKTNPKSDRPKKASKKLF